MSNIIDLELERERRKRPLEAETPSVRDQLAEFMTKLEIETSESELTSVTLHALRDVLDINGLRRRDAKEYIARNLNMFQEECE
jgi:hypothetical protein